MCIKDYLHTYNVILGATIELQTQSNDCEIHSNNASVVHSRLEYFTVCKNDLYSKNALCF
jgi:hypothetical protein